MYLSINKGRQSLVEVNFLFSDRKTIGIFPL